MNPKEIVKLLVENPSEAISFFTIPNNNESTDKIKSEIQKLSEAEKIRLKEILEQIIRIMKCKEEDKERLKIDLISEEEKFYLLENAIYYVGRIGIKPDIDLLKRIYQEDNNFYMKLNVTFTLLPYYIEEVELDFAKKVLNEEEYAQKLRSWTMAFFNGTEHPYEYQDNEKDDCTKAKEARMKRLELNQEGNKKIEKAKAFRLMDLIVIYLFKLSRGEEIFNLKEKEIIQNTKIDWKEYSKEKQTFMAELKERI